MSRKTAVKETQPDLLGNVTPQPKKAQPIAKVAARKDVRPDRRAIAKPSGPKIITGTPADMLRVIAEAAANPKVDPAKMSALLDVQERIAREQARRAFTAAKLDMRPKLPIINRDGCIVIPPKDGKKGQKTPYATFENIMDQIEKPLHDHGFDLFYTTEPTPDGTRIIVIGHIVHIDGHAETTRFPLPAETSGSKNNVQGWMSSFSYGKRGTTIALLNIRTKAPEDQDRDGHAPAVPKAGEVRTIEGSVSDESDDRVPSIIDGKQLRDLKAAIEKCQVGEKKFCEHYGIAKVHDLPASRFSEAMQACRDFGNRR